ncbi:MAG: YggS family pyridoxal phosphate-dependent enzyme [Nitrospira sp.]|nr:YggS family pyridoxal phosphate-dependent enzyme [Nitrospira sp.]
MINIKENLEQVVQRIRLAALRVGRRPEEVRLVAVTKTMGFTAIQEAQACGVRIFGENRVQEAIPKIQQLGQNDIAWHFVGHLQTNKAKPVVGLFDLIHSVDTFRLAETLDTWINNSLSIRTGHHIETVGRQRVLIQVNISGESTKSGVLPEELGLMVKKISSYKTLAVVGLMAIPAPSDDPERSRPFFKTLRELAVSIEKEGIDGVSMKELSMGMSADFDVAIEEGATLVRVGTAIFGQRS